MEVYCDMSSDQQTGITVVHHDKEERASVDGRRGPGPRVVNITYSASMEQIQALVSLSSDCEQYLSYDCFESPVFSRPYRHAQYRQHVTWYSRQNTRMINWAGAEGQDGKCACGVTGHFYSLNS
ncbi:neurexin-4-like [Branchiostoma floridae x Branchiostoma japonicum]